MTALEVLNDLLVELNLRHVTEFLEERIRVAQRTQILLRELVFTDRVSGGLDPERQQLVVVQTRNLRAEALVIGHVCSAAQQQTKNITSRQGGRDLRLVSNRWSSVAIEHASRVLRGQCAWQKGAVAIGINRADSGDNKTKGDKPYLQCLQNQRFYH